MTAVNYLYLLPGGRPAGAHDYYLILRTSQGGLDLGKSETCYGK